MTTLENPLVSIIVCTYNSSKYVIETLESARAQTYQNIELIISDDCSTDNSLELCREWVDKNNLRFMRVEILTVRKNTGVASNANRSLRAARGEWIKYMAADDLLLEDCIKNNLKYIQQARESISFLFSRCKFLVNNEFNNNHQRMKYYHENEKEFNKSARGQFLSIIKESFACPPTIFIRRSTLIELNGFDESFYETEDVPLYLKATLNGHKLYFYPIETIIYRFHDKSLSEQYYFKWVYIEEKIIQKYFLLKYKLRYPFHYLDFRLTYWNKKRRAEKKRDYGKITKMINPLLMTRYIQKKFRKR